MSDAQAAALEEVPRVQRKGVSFAFPEAGEEDEVELRASASRAAEKTTEEGPAAQRLSSLRDSVSRKSASRNSASRRQQQGSRAVSRTDQGSSDDEEFGFPFGDSDNDAEDPVEQQNDVGPWATGRKKNETIVDFILKASRGQRMDGVMTMLESCENESMLILERHPSAGGISSLHAAIRVCDARLLAMLLDRSSSGKQAPESRTCIRGGSLVHWWAAYGWQEGQGESEALLELVLPRTMDEQARKASIESFDKHKRTPIFWACGSPTQTEILIRMGADITAKDKSGESCLLYALRFRCEKVVEQLYVALDSVSTGQELLTPELFYNFVDRFPQSPFLGSLLDGKIKVGQAILENGVGKWQYDFDMQILDPPAQMRKNPFQMIVERASRIVAHPLVENLLSRKWKGYVRSVYYSLMATQSVRVLAMFAIVYNLREPQSQAFRAWLLVLLVFTLPLATYVCLLFWRRVQQAYFLGWRRPSHFFRLDNLIWFADQLFTMILASVKLSGGWAYREENSIAQKTFTGLQFFLVFLTTISMFRWGNFGTQLLMITRILVVDLPPFLLLGGMLIVAFAGLIGSVADVEGLDEMPIKAMIMGVIDGNGVEDARSLDPFVLYLFVAFYLFILPVTLMNLMIASFSYTYEKVISEVKVLHMLEKARFVADIDLILGPWFEDLVFSDGTYSANFDNLFLPFQDPLPDEAMQQEKIISIDHRLANMEKFIMSSRRKKLK